MTKTVLYTYLGTNGTITSTVHLEDIYYIRKDRLVADARNSLTKDVKTFVQSVTIPEDELDEWREVGQK